MWKTIFQAIAFVAVILIIVYAGVRIVKQQKANDLELQKLQVELNEDAAMIDELVNNTWKLKRDTDMLLVRVWAFWMVKEGLPFNIHPIENPNFPPYASIYEPFVQGIHLESV